MARPTPFQLLRDGLMDFVARETELAKAELIPAAKQAGIGSAFVGAAVTFLLHSLWMLVCLLSPSDAADDRISVHIEGRRAMYQ